MVHIKTRNLLKRPSPWTIIYVELDRAKKMVQDLTAKLTIINESKELALEATKVAKIQTNQLNKEISSDSNQTGKAELERSRQQYASVIMELDATKQDLRRIRKEFESSVKAKISAFNQESEAKHQAEVNSLKANQLSKEIATIQESLIHVKLQNCKAKLEAAVAAESKAISASDELTSTLQQLKFESDSALQEAKAMKQEAAELRIGTESKRSSLLEIQKKLEVALKDEEAAKVVEAQESKRLRTCQLGLALPDHPRPQNLEPLLKSPFQRMSMSC